MLKKIKELLKDVSFYGLSQVLSQAISFLLLPLYTQYLSPSDYGILALLGIITSVFGPLSLLGVNGALFRYVGGEKLSEQQERVYISNAFIIVTLNTAVLLIAGVIFSSFLSDITFSSKEHTHLVRLSLVAGAIGSLTSIPLAVLRVKRKVKGIVILNTIGLVLNIGLTIYFVAFLKRGLLGAIEASIISNSLNLLPLLYFIKDVSLKHIRKTNSKELLSYGLPNVPHYLMALAFSYYTSFSLNKLLSTQELGLYSMAQKFALPFSLLMNSIQASWNAYKFEILKNEDNAREIFKKFSRYLLAVYLLAHVITIIAGKYLLYIATTDIYYKAAEYIPFLSFIVFANAIYYVYGTGVAFGKNQNFAPLISMMGLIIIISTNYYFTIHFGTKGAAISNALAWIGMTVIVFVISEKLYKIGNSKKLMIEIFLFSLIAVITHDYLHSHYPLMNILGSLVLLSFTFVFIRYRIITGEEIKSGLSIIYSKLNLK